MHSVPGPPTPSPSSSAPAPEPASSQALVEILIISGIVLVLAIAATQVLAFFDSAMQCLSYYCSCIPGIGTGNGENGSVVMGEVAPEEQVSSKVTNITIVNNAQQGAGGEMILADVNGDGNLEAINSITGEVHYLSQASIGRHRQSVHV